LEKVFESTGELDAGSLALEVAGQFFQSSTGESGSLCEVAGGAALSFSTTLSAKGQQSTARPSFLVLAPLTYRAAIGSERPMSNHDEAAMTKECGDEGARQHKQEADHDCRRNRGERRLNEKHYEANEGNTQIDDDKALAGITHAGSSGCIRRYGSPQ
jgi:hypothetical protein